MSAVDIKWLDLHGTKMGGGAVGFSLGAVTQNESFYSFQVHIDGQGSVLGPLVISPRFKAALGLSRKLGAGFIAGDKNKKRSLAFPPIDNVEGARGFVIQISVYSASDTSSRIFASSTGE
jgi:hypothetical protein